MEGLQSPRNEGIATLALNQPGFPSLPFGQGFKPLRFRLRLAFFTPSPLLSSPLRSQVSSCRFQVSGFGLRLASFAPSPFRPFAVSTFGIGNTTTTSFLHSPSYSTISLLTSPIYSLPKKKQPKMSCSFL